MKAVLLGPVWTFLPGPWAPATAVKAGKPPIGLEVQCTHTDSSSGVEYMPAGLFPAPLEFPVTRCQLDRTLVPALPPRFENGIAPRVSG